MCESLESLKNQLTDIKNNLAGSKEELCEEYDSERAGLHNLPVEIILKICSFLDAQFLKNTLSKVSQRFDDILADDHLWKYWVHSKIKGYYPAIPDLKKLDEEPIDWEEVCVEMDIEMKKWTNVKDSMRHIVVKDVHFASVDTVLLINNGNMCISGGRDRGMSLLHVMDIKPHSESDNFATFTDINPKVIKHDAHAGWVWDLAPDDYITTTKVYSASWDNTVKSWDLATGLDCLDKFPCGMSALSVVAVDHEVMVGLYSKKILSFDPRRGPEPLYSYKPHKGPVLALHAFNNLLGSISEDRTLAMWDRTAGKLLYNVKLPTDKAFPVCISWSPSALYVGDSKGSLHLYNPETHKYIKTLEIWPEPPLIMPSSKITGCHQSKGNMIICSDRGDIKFLYNSYPPQQYACIKSSTYDVTQMRYLNGILVIGTCDASLEFWIPTDKFPDL